MIETVFSKSAYGSLKLAQNCGADKHSSASIGLVLSGRTNISPEELETLKADAELQAHRKWETSIPLGGNPADVYCIDVAWSMGDISDDEIGNNRKSVLEQAFFVWPNREDNEQYILETLRSAKTALHEILDRASRGEPVRIWYSHNPDEFAGSIGCWRSSKSCPQSAQYMLSNCRNGNTLPITPFVRTLVGEKSRPKNGGNICLCNGRSNRHY